LDIKPNVSDGIPSLTSLIIANEEELKEYIITEKEEVFAWTNDVLQFKKLKPVIINLQYVKKNPITYSIQGITFDDIPETYIQEIVNRDIEEIMGMDKSSTTILNSFDFCPRPETLPDYVIKKEEYAKYWNENILSERDYKDFYLYAYDDNVLRSFFLCKSSENIGLENICNPTETKDFKISSNSSATSFSGRRAKEEDLPYIKWLSLVIDRYFLNIGDERDTIAKIDKSKDTIASSLEGVLNKLNVNGDLDEISYCSIGLFFSEAVKDENTTLKDKDQLITDNIFNNLNISSSSFCLNFENETNIDTHGFFLKNFFYQDEILSTFRLLEKCNNLNNFII